jgi:hypothetical protein
VLVGVKSISNSVYSGERIGQEKQSGLKTEKVQTTDILVQARRRVESTR